MKLLVDIGNSRIKWTLEVNGEFSGHAAAAYGRNRLTGQLDQFWADLEAPDHIWVSNVAGPEIETQLRNWCVSHWTVQPQFAQVTQTCAGVNNAYADVTRLGIDRWLGVIAAWARYQNAVLIADCGTAVTIDAVDQQGQHLGGLIVPGSALMRDALYKTTPAIPVSHITESRAGLAGNTDQAVVNGCTLAIAALIERVLYDLKRGGVASCQCILTGGGAAAAGQLLTVDYLLLPCLVLEGLAIYARQNA